MSNLLAEIEKAVPVSPDITIPPHVELQIAAHQRLVLRNMAVALKLQINLATLRDAKEEVKLLSIKFDSVIKDLTQLDVLYPAALNAMRLLDVQ